MLRAAVVFFALAILALVLGFSGVAGLSVDIAQSLLVVFVILAVISLVAGLISGRKPTVLP